MDIIKITNSGNFNSGAQAISTASTMQKICRIQPKGRRTLTAITVIGGTIADFQVLQGAFPDDPNPLVVADGTGFNSPALADESYVIPALTFPFGPGTFQVKLQGDASELIFQAQGASGTGVTVTVAGSVNGLHSD